MKRIVLAFTLMCAYLSVIAQSYNAVFPIVNTYTKGEPEFIAASISMTYEYMGKKVYVADGLQWWQGSRDWGISNGTFLSFTYVARSVSKFGSEWNTGSTTTQMAFHPGGEYEVSWSSSMTATGSPMYAFSLSSKGLRIVNLRDYSVVASLDDGTNPKNFASITVFAGNNVTDKDFIVVAGEGTFKVFETIPNTSGVRAISYSGSAHSYFDINGQSLSEPKKGINIVVDGDTTKKIVVK